MARSMVDISGYQSRIDRIRRATPDASAELILEITRETMFLLVRISPKDTRRYARAWAEAAKDVGVWSGPLPALQASRKREEFLGKLAEQVGYWTRKADKLETFRDFYKRQGRTAEPYYWVITKELRTARRRAARSVEELERATGSEFAIFFDMESIVQRKQKRSLHTVRHKVYGGHGQVFTVDGRFFVRITNKEPHAKIIERHPHMGHPKATAVAFARAAGLGNASPRWVAKLAAASKAA